MASGDLPPSHPDTALKALAPVSKREEFGVPSASGAGSGRASPQARLLSVAPHPQVWVSASPLLQAPLRAGAARWPRVRGQPLCIPCDARCKVTRTRLSAQRVLRESAPFPAFPPGSLRAPCLRLVAAAPPVRPSALSFPPRPHLVLPCRSLCLSVVCFTISVGLSPGLSASPLICLFLSPPGRRFLSGFPAPLIPSLFFCVSRSPSPGVPHRPLPTSVSTWISLLLSLSLLSPGFRLSLPQLPFLLSPSLSHLHLLSSPLLSLLLFSSFPDPSPRPRTKAGDTQAHLPSTVPAVQGCNR